MRRTAALIVGGGPAGSAAAIMLARGGAAPELVERTDAPHDTVCGGFLGWDALGALHRLGIDADALGAHPIRRVRIVAAGRRVETDLPHAAAGLSRRVLDEAMLAAAKRAGAVVRRGVRVVEASPETREVRLADGEEVTADALLLATGKHELRGAARPLDDYAEETSVGFRTALPPSARLHAALSGTIELHFHDGGYTGLLLQEDGTTNVCVSALRGRLAAAGGIGDLLRDLAVEAPLLGERIGDAANARWDAVSGVPYGWRAHATAPGVFRLGDQSAVISSLAGDGVAIALNSGLDAAAALLRYGPAGAQRFQSAFARRAALPVGLANALRHAAESRRTRPTLMRVAAIPGMTTLAARLTRIG